MEELSIPSYRDLAKRAGVSHGTINAQKNQLKPPSIETAEGLCRALYVSWAELWARAGYIPHIDPKTLQGVDAEIYEALQLTNDEDFKKAILTSLRTWIELTDEKKK